MATEVPGQDVMRKTSFGPKARVNTALPNILPEHVCDSLVREVFAEKLIPRPEKLAEDVREYIKEVLTELCESACGTYPFFLNEVETRLLDEFVNEMESRTKETVLNVCYAELLGWAFTQNAYYEAMLKEVDEEVDVACKRIFDTIPKQVHHFLVAGIYDGLEDWTLDRVTSEDLEKWLVEDPRSQRKRKEMHRKRDQFQEGTDILAT